MAKSLPTRKKEVRARGELPSEYPREQFKKGEIIKALRDAHGIKRRAAMALGISPSVMTRWTQRYPELQRYCDSLKAAVTDIARDNIADIIIDIDGKADPYLKNENSKFWLSRMDPEFRQDKSTNVTVNQYDITIQLDENLRRKKEEAESRIYIRQANTNGYYSGDEDE